jgi:hypothetical protein
VSRCDEARRCLSFVQIILLGRDRLKWEEYNAEIREQSALEQALLGGFATDDARQYLAKRGIETRVFVDASLEAARDVQSQAAEPHYQALSLGLLVDTVNEDWRSGKPSDPRTLALTAGPLDHLADRFLQSLGNAVFQRRIVQLACTPRFDSQALQAVCPADPTSCKELSSRILNFSFIQESQRGKPKASLSSTFRADGFETMEGLPHSPQPARRLKLASHPTNSR